MNFPQDIFYTPNTYSTQVDDLKIAFFAPERFFLNKEQLQHIDQIYDDVVSYKNTSGLEEGILPSSGNNETVYLKRKIYGNTFWLFNFLRKEHPFAKARCTLHALKAGIPTPQLLAIGVKMRHGFVKCVYIVVESIPEAVPVLDIFSKPNARARVNLFVEDGTRLLAALHNNGIFHGDLQLHNFFYSNALLFIWNLGDLQKSNGKNVSKKHILKDLTSFGVAIFEEASKHRPILDDFIGFDNIAENLLLSYGEVAQGWIPSCSQLSHGMNKMWSHLHK